MVLLLTPGTAQAGLPQRSPGLLQPGAALGLSHCSLLGHLNNVGGVFPGDVNVVMVAPKGMGPSVSSCIDYHLSHPLCLVRLGSAVVVPGCVRLRLVWSLQGPEPVCWVGVLFLFGSCWGPSTVQATRLPVYPVRSFLHP